MVRRVCEYKGGAFVSALLLATRGGHLAVCQVRKFRLNDHSGHNLGRSRYLTCDVPAVPSGGGSPCGRRHDGCGGEAGKASHLKTSLNLSPQKMRLG